MHNGAGAQLGLSFMHQDRLGSALVITDKGGAILQSDGAQWEFRSFDAFGKARDNRGSDSLQGRLFANNPSGKRNRKGFTEHEHLDEAGLIHMNGRAYDYNLGRFYGVDPIIQFPTNSQSLNDQCRKAPDGHQQRRKTRKLYLRHAAPRSTPSGKIKIDTLAFLIGIKAQRARYL